MHPSVRRRGLGRRLIADGGPPGVPGGLPLDRGGGGRRHPGGRLLRGARFQREYVEIRSVLDLSTVDWAALAEMAARHRARATAWSSTRADRRRSCSRRTPRRRPRSADDDGRPGSAAELVRPAAAAGQPGLPAPRGMKPYIVLAIHEATGDGGRADRGGRAGAAPDPGRPVRHHRGARPTGATASTGRSRPGCCSSCGRRSRSCAEVQTWNARTNEAMLEVNAELGFQADRRVVRVRRRRRGAGPPPRRGQPGEQSAASRSAGFSRLARRPATVRAAAGRPRRAQ